jgi:hygromycin-B 7''-O-kinase
MDIDTGWPPVTTDEEYQAADLLPGVRRLCRSLGVNASNPVRYATGSLPVFALGDLVLKLFVPECAEDARIEAGVLEAVAGRLPVPTPRVHHAGLHDGWGYVVMDRLAGRPLLEVWPAATPSRRDSIAGQLGEMIAALHELPAPEIDGWFPDGWDAFVAAQSRVCVAHQRQRRLAEHWLAQIPEFLRDVPLDNSPALLHTEINGEHLYVDDDWRLSGLLDFETAMRGACGYEFVAPGLFLADGDSRFLSRLYAAYGRAVPPLELMAWTLLHRYSSLASYLRRLPEPPEPTLDALAERWFGT